MSRNSGDIFGSYVLDSIEGSRIKIRFTRSAALRIGIQSELQWGVALNCAHLATLAYADRQHVLSYLELVSKSAARTHPLQLRNNTIDLPTPFFRPHKGTWIEKGSLKCIDKSGSSWHDNFTSPSATNTQLALFEDDARIYCTVRGTEGFSWPNGLRDWISNAQASQVDFREGHGQVHKGFYDCFRSVKADIDSYINPRKGKPVIVTGHSLGGAVATIIAAYIRDELAAKVLLYTFGSPKAGDKNFVDFYTRNQRVDAWRFFHVSDVVPLILPGRVDLALPLVPLAAFGAAGLAALVVASTDFDDSPFTHFGRPVALRRTPQGEAMAIIEPSTPPPFEVYTSEKLGWGRITFGGICDLLGDAIVGAHEMSMYLGLISSCLRQTARKYVAADPIQSDTERTNGLTAMIAALETEQQQLILDSYHEGGIMAPDATYQPGASRIDSETKTRAIEVTMQGLRAEKLAYESMQRFALSAEDIARSITTDELDAHVHREITYHASLDTSVKSGF